MRTAFSFREWGRKRLGVAPWDRAWCRGGRGGVRIVTACQAEGHHSREGADFLRHPIPTVQKGRLRPREESETPRVLGVATSNSTHSQAFGPKSPDNGLFLTRRQQQLNWIRSLQFFCLFFPFYFKMCFKKTYFLANQFLLKSLSFLQID